MHKLCPECGRAYTDNYCPLCGCRLITEEEYEEHLVRMVEKSLNPEEAKGRPGEAAPGRRQPGVIRSSEPDYEEEEYYSEDEDPEGDYPEEYYPEGDGLLSSEMGGERLTSVLGRGLRKVGEMICTALRLISAVLMTAAGLYLAWGLLSGVGDGLQLSSLRDLFSGAGTVYLAGSLGLLLYCFLQVLWILRVRRMKNAAGDRRKEDPGHGIFGFGSFLVLGLAAAPLAGLLPGESDLLMGIRGILTAVSGLELLAGMGFLGLILCVLRRICGSANW